MEHRRSDQPFIAIDSQYQKTQHPIPLKESPMRFAESPAPLLPYAAPASPYRRLLLFAIRRMAIGGLDDAHAAHAIFTGFGRPYRRPLMLLRALMADLSRVANVTLTVAHCCCPRMTRDEAILLDSIAEAAQRPLQSHAGLCGLLHVPSCQDVLASGEAVAMAFVDLGMPLNR
jgi:hypothetical protein